MVGAGRDDSDRRSKLVAGLPQRLVLSRTAYAQKQPRKGTPRSARYLRPYAPASHPLRQLLDASRALFRGAVGAN